MPKEIVDPVYITIVKIKRDHCWFQREPIFKIRLITNRETKKEKRLSCREHLDLWKTKAELFKLHPGCNRAIKTILNAFVVRVKLSLEKNQNLKGHPLEDDGERQLMQEIVRDFDRIYMFQVKAPEKVSASVSQ